MLNQTFQKRRALTQRALKIQPSLWLGFDAHTISGQQIYQQSHIKHNIQKPPKSSTLRRWTACGIVYQSPSHERDINYITFGANNLYARLLVAVNLTESEGGKKMWMCKVKQLQRGRENITEKINSKTQLKQDKDKAPHKGPFPIRMIETKLNTTRGNKKKKKASVGKAGHLNYRGSSFEWGCP